MCYLTPFRYMIVRDSLKKWMFLQVLNESLHHGIQSNAVIYTEGVKEENLRNWRLKLRIIKPGKRNHHSYKKKRVPRELSMLKRYCFQHLTENCLKNYIYIFVCDVSLHQKSGLRVYSDWKFHNKRSSRVKIRLKMYF